MLHQAHASSLMLSRRSACDRCKAYKLKCLRQGKANDPCQRCAKADLACTTTVEQVAIDGASSQSKKSTEQRRSTTHQLQRQQQRQRQRNDSEGETNDHADSTLLPRAQDQHRPLRRRFTNHPRLLPRQNINDRPNEMKFPGADGNLPQQFSTAQNAPSIPLTDPILSQEDLNMLIADYVPHPYHPDHDSFMKIGFDDEDTLGPPTNSCFNELIDPSSLSADFNHTQHFSTTPDAPLPPVEVSAAGQHSHHEALIDLQLEFIHDLEKLNRTAKLPHPPGHNPLKCSTAAQHHPINRLLNHTARFWEVLKAMCVSSTKHSAGDDMQGSSPSSSHKTITGTDHILLVTMVATYIMLLRSCREVFARLYAGFELAATDPTISLADASLPKLQFGELEIENNLQLQVNILIELISSMLERIAGALQISSPASTGKGTTAPSDHSLPFWSNSTAILVRDSILNEERSQTGDFRLGELMKNVKDILTGRSG